MKGAALACADSVSTTVVMPPAGSCLLSRHGLHGKPWMVLLHPTFPPLDPPQVPVLSVRGLDGANIGKAGRLGVTDTGAMGSMAHGRVGATGSGSEVRGQKTLTEVTRSSEDRPVDRADVMEA
jgi:hypothetical protein